MCHIKFYCISFVVNIFFQVSYLGISHKFILCLFMVLNRGDLPTNHRNTVWANNMIRAHENILIYFKIRKRKFTSIVKDYTYTNANTNIKTQCIIFFMVEGTHEWFPQDNASISHKATLGSQFLFTKFAKLKYYSNKDIHSQILNV